MRSVFDYSKMRAMKQPSRGEKHSHWWRAREENHTSLPTVVERSYAIKSALDGVSY
jgi:hypothetical protein